MMRAAVFLAGTTAVSALTIPTLIDLKLPSPSDIAALLPFPSTNIKLPLASFPKHSFEPLSLEDALNSQFDTNSTAENAAATPQSSSSLQRIQAHEFSAQATCTNPRYRWEWEAASDDTKRAFTDAVLCLLRRPSAGGYGASQNRYEDFVQVHQRFTPTVHQNAKFLLWHRYFLWAFEDVLRTECGFTNDLPWFDETLFSGRFSQSSIFSDQWFGRIGIGGNCVTTGRFANLRLNIGPGTGSGAHCLARNGDASATANTNQAMVDACNQRSTYADMAYCAERGAHAWGHNGIGAVMLDVYGSPGDPVFWMHHMFIDRNYRVWQNADPARITAAGLGGTDSNGNAITMDTTIDIAGLRPTRRVSDVINTLGDLTCYRYNR